MQLIKGHNLPQKENDAENILYGGQVDSGQGAHFLPLVRAGLLRFVLCRPLTQIRVILHRVDKLRHTRPPLQLIFKQSEIVVHLKNLVIFYREDFLTHGMTIPSSFLKLYL